MENRIFNELLMELLTNEACMDVSADSTDGTLEVAYFNHTVKCCKVS